MSKLPTAADIGVEVAKSDHALRSTVVTLDANARRYRDAATQAIADAVYEACKDREDMDSGDIREATKAALGHYGYDNVGWIARY